MNNIDRRTVNLNRIHIDPFYVNNSFFGGGWDNVVCMVHLNSLPERNYDLTIKLQFVYAQKTKTSLIIKIHGQFVLKGTYNYKYLVM